MSPGNSTKRAVPARRGLTPCKRKRRPYAATASYTAAPKESEPSLWATLSGDRVRLIAGRLLTGDVTDYLRFRAVCPEWRSSTECPRRRGVADPRFHPRHWMMLPEGYSLYPGHTRLRGRVRFFNLRTGAFASVHIPLFKDHFVMDSVDGLLLLHRDHDMAVRLFHPFTGDIVELPSLATLEPQLMELIVNPMARACRRETETMRSVVAAVSFSPDDEGVVTVMLALKSNRVRRVAFATSEDQKWTLSNWAVQHTRMDILSFQGKIYFLTTRAEIWVVDPPQQVKKGSRLVSPSLLPPRMVAAVPRDKVGSPMFLAECNSEILLVGTTARSFRQVRVYRLADLVLGRLIPLKSIGGNSLFLFERSLCVSSKVDPAIAGDSVFRVHPSLKHLGQYHLRNRTWSIATDGDLSDGPVPSPFTLIYHIFTCCDRLYWNKGHMFCRAKYPKWGVKSKWRAGG